MLSKFQIPTAVCFLVASAFSQTIASKTAAMRKMPGYFPLYWEDKTGKLWLEIDKFNTEFLYVNSLPAGLGSNDVGLDRGQIGSSRIVRFERSGPRVLLVQPNYRFRAVSGDEMERWSVEQSFAQSVLWGFDSAAEEDGRLLVDATAFFLSDVHYVPEALRRTDQGAFHVDATRKRALHAANEEFPQEHGSRSYPDFYWR